jgi:predicted transcriptional regulator
MGESNSVRECVVNDPEVHGTMSEIKDAVLELAQQLPEECTWDDVMYRIFVRQKIDAGLRDADSGRMISDDDVFREFSDESDPVD